MEAILLWVVEVAQGPSVWCKAGYQCQRLQDGWLEASWHDECAVACTWGELLPDASFEPQKRHFTAH